MDKQVNGLAAVGGLMIAAGFVCYIAVSYDLAKVLWAAGGILFFAGLMTLEKK